MFARPTVRESARTGKRGRPLLSFGNRDSNFCPIQDNAEEVIANLLQLGHSPRRKHLLPGLHDCRKCVVLYVFLGEPQLFKG